MALWKILIRKKDMVNFAQLRLYYACKIQLYCAGLGPRILGMVSTKDLGSTGLTLMSAFQLIQTPMAGLIQNNQAMLQGVDFFGEDIKQMLFQKDVHIFGSLVDSSDTKNISMTSFQAVDQYHNALQALINSPQPVSLANYQIVNFITKNILDDFCLKNNQITAIFQASMAQRQDHLQTMTYLCLFVTPLSIAVIVAALLAFINRQYMKEKSDMLKFIMMQPGHVRHAKQIFQHFRDSVYNEDVQVQDQDQYQTTCFEVFDTLPRERQIVDHQGRRKKNLQTVTTLTMKRHYYKYILKIGVYAVIIISVMIASLLYTARATGVYITGDRVNSHLLTISVQELS